MCMHCNQHVYQQGCQQNMRSSSCRVSLTKQHPRRRSGASCWITPARTAKLLNRAGRSLALLTCTGCCLTRASPLFCLVLTMTQSGHLRRRAALCSTGWQWAGLAGSVRRWQQPPWLASIGNVAGGCSQKGAMARLSMWWARLGACTATLLEPGVRLAAASKCAASKRARSCR